MTIHPIAHAHNGFVQKFGIPRQAGRATSVMTRIVFTPNYRIAEALRGIEQWSHLWLIWGFSENPTEQFSPTVRPPRLGGNTRLGVFATRSPFRPNGLGLSSVKLEKVEHTTSDGYVLLVSGADLMNGTPIYDIKPYLPYTDTHPDATSGFASNGNNYRLPIEWNPEIKPRLNADLINEITEILQEDPRPAYKSDSEQIYHLSYKNFEVDFKVNNKILKVLSVVRRKD